MFQRTAFPFSDEGGAGQDDCQHGDIIHQLHDRTEPALREILVEAVANDQSCRLIRRA